MEYKRPFVPNVPGVCGEPGGVVWLLVGVVDGGGLVVTTVAPSW